MKFAIFYFCIAIVTILNIPFGSRLEGLLQVNRVDDATTFIDHTRTTVHDILSSDMPTFDNTVYPIYKLMMEIASFQENSSNEEMANSALAIIEEEVFQNSALYYCLGNFICKYGKDLDAYQEHLARKLLKAYESPQRFANQEHYIRIQNAAQRVWFNENEFSVIDFDLQNIACDLDLRDNFLCRLLVADPDVVCLQGVVSEALSYEIYEKLQENYPYFYIKIGADSQGEHVKPFGVMIGSKKPIAKPQFTSFADRNRDINERFFYFLVTDEQEGVVDANKYQIGADFFSFFNEIGVLTHVERTMTSDEVRELNRQRLACRGDGGRGKDAGFNNGYDRGNGHGHDRCSNERGEQNSRDRGDSRDNDRHQDDAPSSHGRLSGSVEVDRQKVQVDMSYKNQSADGSTSYSLEGSLNVDKNGNASGSIKAAWGSDF